MMLWTSYPESFHNSDAKFMQHSPVSATYTARSGCCRCCSCCWGHSGVYCSRRRLCVLIFVVILIALLMLAAGFVAGWFGSQLQQQQSPGAAAVGIINVTGKFDLPRLFYLVSRPRRQSICNYCYARRRIR